jgi:hypothetical protein
MMGMVLVMMMVMLSMVAFVVWSVGGGCGAVRWLHGGSRRVEEMMASNAVGDRWRVVSSGVCGERRITFINISFIIEI